MSEPAPLQPVLRSLRFRAERSEQWEELERLVLLYERRGPRALSEAELLALPRLYRAALSGLSVARATSLDQGVVRYLESLSSRAYYAIYGNPGNIGPRIVRFLRRDWPAAMRAMVPEMILAALAMLLGAVVAFALVTGDPEWFFRFVPEDYASGRDPSASADMLRGSLYDGADRNAGDLGVFASYLFTHNAGVAIFAFALGFALGIPTLLLMFYNGTILGAFFAVFVDKQLGVELGGWLIIHGATEVTAILVAGAAGLHIGRAVAFPQTGGVRRDRLEVTRAHGGRAGLVMGGAVMMLFFAGFIEGFGRQLITSDIIRYGLGLGSLALWMVYFYLARSGEGARPASWTHSIGVDRK